MAESVIFNMKFKQAKQGFFDQGLIKAKMDEVTLKRLSEFGSFTMTRARRSIRSSKKSSLPGRPPRSHVGLLEHGQAAIVFVYDSSRKSVVIGPTLTNKSSGAPKTLEHGGTVSVEGQTIFIKLKGGRRGVKGYNKITLHGTRAIAPRPFMQPAFDAELQKHMDKWKDSIRH